MSAAVGSEAFGVACGLAVVVGALSVVAPGLDVLVAAMVALGVAGWASLHRGGDRSAPWRGDGRLRFAGAFLLLGAGAVLFVTSPAPLAAWRAFLLGLAIVPLWSIERRRAVRAPERAA